MKSAKFVPSANATDYVAVQDEAVAFYRAQKPEDERSWGQVSRMAAAAAKRWERSVVDGSKVRFQVIFNDKPVGPKHTSEESASLYLARRMNAWGQTGKGSSSGHLQMSKSDGWRST